MAAHDAGAAFREIIYSDRLLIHPLARKLVRQKRRGGVPTTQVTPDAFRRVSKTQRASGGAAILGHHWTDLSDLDPHQGLCWIALERIQSPGNLGTLIRTARAVGCAGFLLIGEDIDLFSPPVVRAAMGGFFSQIFVRTDARALGSWLVHHGIPAVGAAPDAGPEILATPMPRRPLLVLGEERKGLSTAQEGLCCQKVRIPMEAGADSLNLGVAGSLMLYEVYRRHGCSQVS